MGLFNSIGKFFAGVFNPCISIFLKEKIDENILTNTLIKIGLVSKKIEKRYLKDNDIILYIENYFCFSYFGDNDTAKITIDKENSCIEINCEGLVKSDIFLGDLDDNGDNENKFILEIKEILFKEKILDEVLDRSEEYKNNPKKYEANTDDIIERIEKGKIISNILTRDDVEPYNLFIIKHFIKFVIDKYKEEKLYIEKIQPYILSHIKQCEDKIIEIKEIIKDFDYSDKKTYEEATSKIEKDLEKLENKDISVSRVNEIIDEINKIYRNAYNKKNNVSSLSYIMETDENIDLINKIDIENLE